MLKVPGAVKARAQSYRLVNGVLNYRPIREVGQFDLDEGWVVAVPAALRTQVIKECHGDSCHGHGGTAKTVIAIRQRYHFRRIAKTVREFIRTCIPCRRAKTLLGKKDAPLLPMLSFHPFVAIAVDLYSPGYTTPQGYRYILTVVDLYAPDGLRSCQ